MLFLDHKFVPNFSMNQYGTAKNGPFLDLTSYLLLYPEFRQLKCFGCKFNISASIGLFIWDSIT